MSNDFDIMFEAHSPCCGDSLHWVWDEAELRFETECSCMKRYHLHPETAVMETDEEGFESYDE